MVKIKLPNGEIAKGKIGERIIDFLPGKIGLVAKINGKLFDLTNKIPESCKEVEVLDFNNREGKATYWHTTSHILAQAVKELYPKALLGIGPSIETGFYYDFDLGSKVFTPQDLEKIERKMKEIVNKDIPLIRKEISKSKALKLFKERREKYKIELIKELKEERITVYWQNNFVDLCKGPHLPSTGYVKHLKLINSSSSYWKGNEKGPTLQRIYGVSFPSKELLEQYLYKLEEAKKRDHRIIGTKLDLFSIHEVLGAGLICWHPKGAIIRREVENFWVKEHLKRGYQLVYTPHIAKSELWKTSGHMSYYKEYMYTLEKENEEYVLKPMNCPFHVLIYKSKTRSYRDLPIRYCELGTVYRYEKSGVLHGLLRVRGFTQDDAHIFCTPDQLKEEVMGVIDLMQFILQGLGFKEYKVTLSTRDPTKPEKYMGSDEDWFNAQRALSEALKKKGLEFMEAPGEAVFYGPKIDVKLIDSLGREWQGPTIQVDFNLPKRFDVTYVGPDGKEHLAVMVHRALLGSFERFFGLLIEHYAGDFPLWLAPVQVKVIPVSDKNLNYAREVYRTLYNEGFRVELDDRAETMNYKVREAEMQKIRYMVIIGGKEEKGKNVSVRKRKEGNIGVIPLNAFIKMLKKEITEKI